MSGQQRQGLLARNTAYLALGVAEDDGLCDRESVVEIAQRVKLPFLPLDSCKTKEGQAFSPQSGHRFVHLINFGLVRLSLHYQIERLQHRAQNS